MERKTLKSVLQLIDSVKNFDMSYANRYIDKNYWMPILNSYFNNNHIENITSFDYSRCFTYHINLSKSTANLVSNDMDKYILKNKCFYRLFVDISVLGHYIRFGFAKYYFSEKSTKIEMEYSKNFFIDDHIYYQKKIDSFINDYDMTVLSDDVLKYRLNEINLELKGNNDVTIEDVLFD